MKAGKMLQELAVKIERQNAVIRHSQDITNYAADLEADGYQVLRPGVAEAKKKSPLFRAAIL